MPSKIYASEHQIQSAFFSLLTIKYPVLRKHVFAIPNGGWRGKKRILKNKYGKYITLPPTAAVKMKKEGVTEGVLDVFVSLSNKEYHGLFIEFKSHTGYLSEEQKAFITLKEKTGYKCVVCRSVDEAFEQLKIYLTADYTKQKKLNFISEDVPIEFEKLFQDKFQDKFIDLLA